MKNLLQNQQTKLTDILFENRNKEYGAYVLRTESDRILTKAFFVGIGLLAAVSITPAIISALKPTPEIIKNPNEGFIYTPVQLNPEIEKTTPVQQVSVPQKKEQKEYDATLATPTRNANESKVIKDIPKDAIAGVNNNLTAPPAENTTYSPPITHSGPSTVVPPIVAPPEKKVPNNTIETAVDVEAQFIGGENAFRQKVSNNFDGSSFDSEGLLKTTITFVVEKDGTISNLKADGNDLDFNNEALRTLKTIKGKWTPAKIKGEPVRSYFKFPISMKFE